MPRKYEGKRYRVISYRATDEELFEIDRLCGGRPRSEVVRRAIIEWLTRNKETCPFTYSTGDAEILGRNA
jgi:hypothetical protein